MNRDYRLDVSHHQLGNYRPESVTLVTTLLDARKYSAEDLAKLYARRWKIK